MSRVWAEMSSEKWDEIIEKFAQKIVKAELVFPAKLFLGLSLPFLYIAGQIGRVYLTPFDFLNFPFEYISVFEKRENVEKLIERSDELFEERLKTEKRNNQNVEKKGWRTFFQKYFT